MKNVLNVPKDLRNRFNTVNDNRHSDDEVVIDAPDFVMTFRTEIEQWVINKREQIERDMMLKADVKG